MGIMIGWPYLLLPAVQLDTEVSNGTKLDCLHGHPNIFEMSDMPGESDHNVSIAGHRDHSFFYYLDRVGEGDQVYLVYKEYIYTYFYDKKYKARGILPQALFINI